MKIQLWNSSLPLVDRTKLTLLEAGRDKTAQGIEVGYAIVRGGFGVVLPPSETFEVIAAFIVDPRDASGFEALLSLRKAAQFEAWGNSGDDLLVFSKVGTTVPLTSGKASAAVETLLRKKIGPHLKAAAPVFVPACGSCGRPAEPHEPHPGDRGCI